MKSWKTSLFGMLIAVGMAISGGAAGVPSPLWSKLAAVFQVAGAAGLGLASKDSNVTGGTNPQATVSNIPTLPR